MCVLSEKRVDQSHNGWLLRGGFNIGLHFTTYDDVMSFLFPLSGLFSACLGFAWGGVQPPAPPWALTALRRALPCPLYINLVPH